jgi:hypothetical protein
LLANVVRLKSLAVKMYAFDLKIPVAFGADDGVDLKLWTKLLGIASNASSCCFSKLGGSDKDLLELMFIVLIIRINT